MENTLVIQQQTERKSANQVTTPSIKPDCIEKNPPFDLNSALPVQIDGHSIRTSDTEPPLDELFEPSPASKKRTRTHAIQVRDGDEKNGSVTTTLATKEPALAVEIVMDSDRLGDLSTVVIADKGKGVDPREYGGALYDPKSMIVSGGTTSTRGSDSIELVVHRDKGKNVDPAERGGEMAKYEPGYEPGPSWIDFQDQGAMSFQKRGIALESFKRTGTMDINEELQAYDNFILFMNGLSWHPKISPYRFTMFLLPLVIGTVKAVLSQKGSITTPTTLEWINGIVIFLM